jgi:hypothetical protein
MSDLRVNTISASDGTSPVTLTKQEAAKAWLSGTVDANLTDSLNFSSGIDVVAGDFDYSLTNAAAAQMDDSYLGVTAGGAAYYGRIGTGDTTTTVVDVKIHNSSAALSDSTHFVIFVGDLA